VPDLFTDLSDPEPLGAGPASRRGADLCALVDKHLKFVHWVARRFSNSKENADDITQLVFIRLARMNGVIPGTVSISAWLYMTARSFAIDLVRSDEARRRREQGDALEKKPAVQYDWSFINEAIKSLGPAEREAIMQRFYDNCSYAEVGRLLGLSENAARMKVSRALKKLRAVLLLEGSSWPDSSVSLPPIEHRCDPDSGAIAFIPSPKLLTSRKIPVAAIPPVSLALALGVCQFSQNARLRAGPPEPPPGTPPPGTPHDPLSPVTPPRRHTP